MHVIIINFFFFHCFLPFGFLLFMLTADPVGFARFLRKRILVLVFGVTACSLYLKGVQICGLVPLRMPKPKKACCQSVLDKSPWEESVRKFKIFIILLKLAVPVI